MNYKKVRRRSNIVSINITKYLAKFRNKKLLHISCRNIITMQNIALFLKLVLWFRRNTLQFYFCIVDHIFPNNS